MNKKALSERDICTKFITPSLVAAGWNIDTQVREEVGFTDGRIYVRGKIHTRGKKNAPTTSSTTSPTFRSPSSRPRTTTTPSAQAFSRRSVTLKTLDIPFVFSSNGDGFLFHDKTVKVGTIETEISLRFSHHLKALAKIQSLQRHHRRNRARRCPRLLFDDSDRSPRYYQQIAINRTVEAIARNAGNNRHPPRHGHWHWQNLHRIPNHLPPVEERREETHPLPRRPHGADRSDGSQ